MYIDPKLEAGGAYLLTWNPRITKPKKLQWILHEIGKRKQPITDWSVGRSRHIATGAPFFFLRQGDEHAGIVGWGRIRSAVFETPEWGNEVWLSFEQLLNPGDDRAIPRAELRTDRRTKAGKWDIQSSGTRMSAKVAEGVRRLLLERHVRIPKLDALQPVTQVSTKKFTEGAAKQVLVTRHERSMKAKWKCLEHYGCVCQGCGFDFGLYYGPDADGMIEVHHLRRISQATKSRRVDPIKDLRPLCSNCHRVVHLPGAKADPLPITTLRAMVRRYGKRSSR